MRPDEDIENYISGLKAISTQSNDSFGNNGEAFLVNRAEIARSVAANARAGCPRYIYRAYAYRAAPRAFASSRMRKSKSQRFTLVVIRKFSLTCSRPLAPMRRAKSGCVSRYRI